jgi:hypothetical protein
MPATARCRCRKRVDAIFLDEHSHYSVAEAAARARPLRTAMAATWPTNARTSAARRAAAGDERRRVLGSRNDAPLGDYCDVCHAGGGVM